MTSSASSKRKLVGVSTQEEHRKQVKSVHTEDIVTIPPSTNVTSRPLSSLAPVLRVITGSYEHQILCLSLTVDSSSFCSGSHSEKSDVPSANIFTPIFHFASHTASIRSIAHAKRYLVTGGNDEHIRLYDLQKRKEIGTLMFHEGSVSCMEFTNTRTSKDNETLGSDGKWLLSGGEDGKILIWRTKDWEVLADMKGHKGAVNDISVHPSGKIALSVGRDRTLRLWNLMTAKNASLLKLRNGEAQQVCWNKDGSRYAVGWQRKIAIYDVNSTELCSFDCASPLYRLRYVTVLDADDIPKEYLVSSHANGSITFREIVNDAVAEQFELIAHITRVKDFDFCTRTPPAEFLRAGVENRPTTFMSSVSSDGKVVVWNLRSRQAIAVYETSERLNCCTIVEEEIEKYETTITAAAAALTANEDPNDSDDSDDSESNE
ncbi:WD40-repeat-containing domain protein [Limtongia smithiae]|uniref:WD40-repeat-containing domain protein n=1 Tax=Limtongia smithiae TaxID=1125753 RepID=UPI0034CFC0D7